MNNKTLDKLFENWVNSDEFEEPKSNIIINGLYEKVPDDEQLSSCVSEYMEYGYINGFKQAMKLMQECCG